MKNEKQLKQYSEVTYNSKTYKVFHTYVNSETSNTVEIGLILADGSVRNTIKVSQDEINETTKEYKTETIKQELLKEMSLLLNSKDYKEYDLHLISKDLNKIDILLMEVK